MENFRTALLTLAALDDRQLALAVKMLNQFSILGVEPGISIVEVSHLIQAAPSEKK